VVLSRIQVFYPPIAESAMVSGTVTVRVGVRPDGSVAATTLLHGVPFLSEAALQAASRARFECHTCTEASTLHTMTFVFSLGDVDAAGNPRLPTWKQTDDESSEVIVFGRVPTIGPPPSEKPFHKRAARCLWLWHCGKQGYVRTYE
jgi:TonB family protein